MISSAAVWLALLPFFLQGDAERVQWVRPYREAARASKERNRLLLAKPIYGGTNTPVEGGVLAGGKNDCEGRAGDPSLRRSGPEPSPTRSSSAS